MNVMQPLQGVNLGGWLVVEKWMTPSLFQGTTARNEYELSQTEQGRKRLRSHHQTFMTESDIEWLAEQGIEILRIPFGHWIFGDQPPYEGAIERLDWVITTARKHGLQILLDLHGAPGAQNAAAHSGSGNQPRKTAWLKNRVKQRETIDVLVRIAARYRDQPNIWGIELINEPIRDVTGLRLAWFYRRAYRELTKHARKGTRIVFSDGFSPLLLTNTFGRMSKRDYPVVLDSHFYHCFGRANKSRSFHQHLNRAAKRYWLIRVLSISQPIIVGEWSGVLPYPASSEQTKQFIKTQQYGFRASAATFYWSYKTEPGGRWSFYDMISSESLHTPKR